MNITEARTAHLALANRVAAIEKEAGDELDLMKATGLTGTTFELRSVEFDKLLDETVDAEKAVDKLIMQEDKVKAVREGRAKANLPVNRLDTPTKGGFETPGDKVISLRPRYARLKNFSGTGAEERAYRFGMYWNACRGSQKGREFMNENGMPLMVSTSEDGVQFRTVAMNESLNPAGGFIVNPEFSNDIVDLRETFGKFRAETKIVPMASDTRSDPYRKGGVTAYWNNELSTMTATIKDWGRITLTAKKLTALSLISKELNEDAVINVGDDMAGEYAYAFGYQEDLAGLLGDGSSTYGNIVGVSTQFKVASNLATFTATSGSDDDWSVITLADIQGMMALLPAYARDKGKAKFYGNAAAKQLILDRLMTAGGGNRIFDISQGAEGIPFMGFPFQEFQVMPGVPTASSSADIVLYFGQMALATRMGERRQFTLEFSDSALNAFELDALAMKATERIDINCHSCGAVNNVAAAAGVTGYNNAPLVGLLTAA